MDVYQFLTRKEDGTYIPIDFAKMCTEWNSRILKMLHDGDPIKVFASYRFKTALHLRNFQEVLEQRLAARAILSKAKEEFDRLEKALRRPDNLHLPRVRFHRHHDIQEETEPMVACLAAVEVRQVEEMPPAPGPMPDADLVENQGNGANDMAAEPVNEDASILPVEVATAGKLVQNAWRGLRDVIATHGNDFIDWVLDKEVQICAFCKKPKKINRAFQDGHTNGGCPNHDIPNDQEKKKAQAAHDSFIKKVKNNYKRLSPALQNRLKQ